jgi:hypothetical protein
MMMIIDEINHLLADGLGGWVTVMQGLLIALISVKVTSFMWLLFQVPIHPSLPPSSTVLHFLSSPLLHHYYFPPTSYFSSSDFKLSS